MQFLFYSDDCFILGNVMMKDVCQNKENRMGGNFKESKEAIC